MIYNTQWTRKAEQRKEISRQENNVGFFVVSVSHSNGQYRAHWKKEIDEYKNGYKSTLSYPFADYNGQTRIKDGRFNIKYLEKIDKLLADNIDKYYQIWTQEKYQDLCNEIHSDIQNI